MAIQFGNGQPIDWMAPGTPGTQPQSTQAGASPLQQAMSGYHRVVSHAAGEVKDLLTDYLDLRQQVKRQQNVISGIDESVRLSAQRFEVERATGAELVENQARYLDEAYRLHELERRLGHVAIELFVALGGPCYRDQIVQADYYPQR